VSGNNAREAISDQTRFSSSIAGRTKDLPAGLAAKAAPGIANGALSMARARCNKSFKHASQPLNGIKIRKRKGSSYRRAAQSNDHLEHNEEEV